MVRPVKIISFGINGFEYISQISDYISTINYRTYLTDKANTLDFTIDLMPDLVEPTTIEIADVVGFRIGITDSLSHEDLLITKNCIVDQKELNLFTNSLYYGSQSNNYGLKVSDTQVDNADGNEEATQAEVNVGGTGNETDLPSAFLTITGNLGVTNVVSTDYNAMIADRDNNFGDFPQIGYNDSRSPGKGIWGKGWIKVLEQLAKMYGYVYTFETNQTTIDLNSLFIRFRLLNDLMAQSTDKYVDADDISRSSKFYRDWNNTYRKFIIKYPIWDRNAFGAKGSETYILTVYDNRVPDSIKGTYSTMNTEGFLYGYDYYQDSDTTDNNRPEPPTDSQLQKEVKNALPRIRGLLWEFNNRNFKCEMVLPGSGKYTPGNVIELTGFPVASDINGKWLIEEASHSIDSSTGWLTAIKGFKIEFYSIGQSANSDVQWFQQKYSDWTSNPA